VSKLDVFYWYATCEVYHGGTTEWKQSGGIPGQTRVPSKEELNNYFKAASVAGYDKSVHWCGIFQIYLLKKAGVICHWDRAIVSDGNDLEIVSGEDAKKGLAVGDIVKVSHAQHHLMVLEPVIKGYIRSIEGNAGGLAYPMLAANWMGNAKHNVVEDIQFRYRVVT
jgi:hypothetical protein